MRGALTFRYGLTGVVVLLASAASAGKYVPRTVPEDPLYKNPRGGELQATGLTVPYSGTTSSYGAEYEGDQAFVTCQGTIITEWVWKPDQIEVPPGSGNLIDDPLDTPPEWVIKAETSEAAYSGYYYIGGEGGFTGSCDNGLGFEAEETIEPIYFWDPIYGPILIGYAFAGTSKGTRYTRIPGGETITIDVTPYSQVTVTDGLCSAKVWYGSYIYAPSVELRGVTRFFDPHSIKFLTGQRVEATVRMNGGGAPLPGGMVPVDPASYQWSLSNEAGVDVFKDYITTDTVGDRTLLDGSDRTQSIFHFYTNKDATTTVLCDLVIQFPQGAKLAGGLPYFQAKSREIHSVRPVYIDSKSANDTVWLSLTHIVYGFAKPGQEWYEVEYEVPAPFDQVGDGCFVQLITARRELLRTVTQGGQPTRFVNVLHGVEALDVGFPYSYPGKSFEWSLPLKGHFDDTPRQPLEWGAQYTGYWYKSTADDTFQTWAMYLPPEKDGQPRVWIPIAKLEWTWGGAAQRPNPLSPWTLTSDHGSVTQAPAQTFDFPEWNDRLPFDFGFVGIQ